MKSCNRLALLEEMARKVGAAEKEEAESAPSSDSTEPRKRRTKFGNTEQPSLPVIEQIFELDAADKTCPSCGGVLAPMEGQFETSEMVDVVEVSYRVVKVKQQKYAYKCGGCLETAPGPERAAAGGRYSLDFAIKVAVDKYLDHIPLARQERILRRHGLVVTSQTLWDQLSVLGRRLESASRALMARVLAQPVVGLDQTSWPRLDGKGDKPRQMWCLTAPKTVVHRIRDDKGADTFKSLMAGYEGVIVCNALKTHEAGARGNGAISLAGWWAHVYRKFEEGALDLDDLAGLRIHDVGLLARVVDEELLACLVRLPHHGRLLRAPLSVHLAKRRIANAVGVLFKIFQVQKLQRCPGTTKLHVQACRIGQRARAWGHHHGAVESLFERIVPERLNCVPRKARRRRTTVRDRHRRRAKPQAVRNVAMTAAEQKLLRNISRR
jgi:transposase